MICFLRIHKSDDRLASYIYIFNLATINDGYIELRKVATS